MAVPSFEELFNQQQQGLGMAGGYPQGTGGAGWPGEQQQQAIPPAAAPTNGQMPSYPQAPPPPPPQGGLGSIGDALASRSNTMIGMGLGMMGGGWAGAAKGFAAGAPVDERFAAAKLAQQQHAASLAQTAQLQREHMGLQRELAYKPQVHFAEEEDPNTGYKRARAFLTFPETGKIQEVPLDQGEKLAAQPGVGATIFNPITQEHMTLPPGTNVKKVRDALSQAQADIYSGKVSPDQAKANQYADRMQMAEDQFRKDNLDQEGFNKTGKLTSALPEWVQPFAMPRRYRDYDAAKQAFITGVARSEGARLNAQQLQAYDKAYFPQPGESPEVLETKREMRRVAIENMRKGESPAARARMNQEPAPAAPGQAGAGTGGAPAQAQPGAAPPVIRSKEERDKLAPGTVYIDENGKRWKKR